MRIHTYTVTERDIFEAAEAASGFGHGVASVHSLARHGSRSHDRAFEVLLSGDGTVQRHKMAGNPHEFAASWDQWGVFLAELFLRDPDMKAGPYRDSEDFHKKTGSLFVGVGMEG